MTDSQHPWLTGSAVPQQAPPPLKARRELPRPAAPQPGVPAPDRADRLPQRTVDRSAALWWLGVHGGAGESTLEGLVPGSRAADHAWPIDRDGAQTNVVILARSSASGLAAARRAATEWAAGLHPSVNLVGLVVVTDAAGKLPKPLRELRYLVAGGVPQTWHLPWVESWRLSESPSLEALPRDVRALAATMTALIRTTSV